MFASAASGPNGITTHAASAGMMVITGPSRNRRLFAALGRMISLKISLTASAIGVSRPSGPNSELPNWVIVSIGSGLRDGDGAEHCTQRCGRGVPGRYADHVLGEAGVDTCRQHGDGVALRDAHLRAVRQ